MNGVVALLAVLYSLNALAQLSPSTPFIEEANKDPLFMQIIVFYIL